MIILVWREICWDLEAPLSTPGGVVEHGYSTEQACDRAIEYLQAPGDQVQRCFRAALRGVEGPLLEYWHPDCLSFRSGPYVAEARLSAPSVAVQIHTVAQAAYALEVALIGCTEFPPLKESLDDLIRSSDAFLGFWEGGEIVGALSFDDRTNSVVITRLVVSPSQLRKGIAESLLTQFMRRISSADRVNVSTAQANAPAISLYRKFGFRTMGVSTSEEGIALVHLSKPGVQ